MKVLSEEFVDAYAYKIVNIHPSLFPKYQGLHTHQRVIDAGDYYHGFTVHWVDKGLDTGPIISQIILEINPKYWKQQGADKLQEHIKKYEKHFYPKIICDIIDSKSTINILHMPPSYDLED